MIIDNSFYRAALVIFPLIAVIGTVISPWALALLLLILIYSISCLNQARDIRHLIDLFAAERGIYFGLEDMSDLQSG